MAALITPTRPGGTCISARPKDSDVFARELARLRTHRGWRWLRGLSHADKDDVVSAALLSAWENRDGFHSERDRVSAWFAGHVRKAARAHRRGEKKREMDRRYAERAAKRRAAVKATAAAKARARRLAT